MRRDLTADQQARVKALFDAIGIKGEFSRTAKRLLRQTPAYVEARHRGEARVWLDSEASSFAEAAYELLLNRAEEAGG
jgi:hypothetical protein